MSTQTQGYGGSNGNKAKGPTVPAGNYIGSTDGELVLDQSKGGKLQLNWRVDLAKKDGNTETHVGGLIHFASLASQESIRITIENLEAFGATNPRGELQAFVEGKLKKLTGFGSAKARTTVKYEVWDGKARPRMSHWRNGMTAKNAPDASTRANAGAQLGALLAMMGEKPGASGGNTAAPEFDFGADVPDPDPHNSGDADFDFGANAPDASH